MNERAEICLRLPCTDGYSNVYTESNREIRKDERPTLKDTVEHMDEYDIVFVGYPKMEQGYICV